MVRQNQEIDRLQLPRIADERQLLSLEQTGELVPILPKPYLVISVKPTTYAYCRPWTLAFLEDLAQAFYGQFHAPLWVTSAVRTVESQHRLRRHNSNAAPETGELTSSHLAGITVDLAKRPLSRVQRKWLEDRLRSMRDAGVIEVAEEVHQACFHIAVTDRYLDWRLNAAI